MKYSSLFMVSALAFSGLTQAAAGWVSQEEETDLRMECIENAIAEELENDQMDSYVNACFEEQVAARQKSNGKKS